MLDKILFYLKDIYEALKVNLLNFQFTKENPWVWLFIILLLYFLLRMWGLRKLLLFVGLLSILFLLKYLVDNNILKQSLVGEETFFLVFKNIIFYCILGFITIYFLFIKQ